MSRKEKLLKHIKEHIDSGMWKYESCYLGKEDLEIIIKALEQEPNTGQWVYNNGSYKCQFCGHEITGIAKDLRYCCKCGARMRMESEDNNKGVI